MQAIIFKTQVPAQACAEYEVELPEGARFLAVQLQRQLPQAWWLCDPSRPLVKRRLLCVGTGIELPAQLLGPYLATWQDGAFVWHLFERYQ
jgi:hypothetical protein